MYKSDSKDQSAGHDHLVWTDIGLSRFDLDDTLFEVKTLTQ